MYPERGCRWRPPSGKDRKKYPNGVVRVNDLTVWLFQQDLAESDRFLQPAGHHINTAISGDTNQRCQNLRSHPVWLGCVYGETAAIGGSPDAEVNRHGRRRAGHLHRGVSAESFHKVEESRAVTQIHARPHPAGGPANGQRNLRPGLTRLGLRKRQPKPGFDQRGERSTALRRFFFSLAQQCVVQSYRRPHMSRHITADISASNGLAARHG